MGGEVSVSSHHSFIPNLSFALSQALFRASLSRTNFNTHTKISAVFTAVNASVATWNFHTVKVDNGPADYSDSLTIIRTH